MQSAEQLVARTAERVQLGDFGGDTFMIGLRALIESIERDARLDDATTAAVEATIGQRLENRLRVEAWYAAEGAGTTTRWRDRSRSWASRVPGRRPSAT